MMFFYSGKETRLLPRSAALKIQMELKTGDDDCFADGEEDLYGNEEKGVLWNADKYYNEYLYVTMYHISNIVNMWRIVGGHEAAHHEWPWQVKSETKIRLLSLSLSRQSPIVLPGRSLHRRRLVLRRLPHLRRVGDDCCPLCRRCLLLWHHG